MLVLFATVVSITYAFVCVHPYIVNAETNFEPTDSLWNSMINSVHKFWALVQAQFFWFSTQVGKTTILHLLLSFNVSRGSTLLPSNSSIILHWYNFLVKLFLLWFWRPFFVNLCTSISYSAIIALIASLNTSSVWMINQF